MKLTSVTVKNYRVHRDTKVDFDPRITLVSGPNESGKSTLVEALHRTLFLRAKTTGKLRERMESNLGGVPEVSLQFEAASRPVTLNKLFKGTQGICRLEAAGEPAVTGDAAEDRLASLLGTTGPVGGNETTLDSRWAYLWVRQGCSGMTPEDVEGDQRDQLVQRLQREGGAAVTQSDLDARIARTFQTQRDELFTAKGDRKANTEWDRGEKELAGHQRDLQEKRTKLQTLEEASERYMRAVADIAAKTQARESGTRELAEVEQKLQTVQELRRDLEPLARSRAEAEASIEGLDQVARTLICVREQGKAATKDLQPREQELATIGLEQESCRHALAQTEAELEKARVSAATARLWQRALGDHLQALEQSRTLDQLGKARAAIAAKRTELQAIQQQIAQIPAVTAREVSALQKLEQEVVSAEATLAALGARIELEAGQQPVLVDGKPLSVGSSQVLTNDAVVSIGQLATLRIRPGGHTGISDARETLATAQLCCQEKLAGLGVASAEEAAAASGQLAVLNGQVTSLEKELKHLDAAGNEEATQEATSAFAEASRRANAAATQVGKNLPACLPETHQERTVADEVCRQAEQDETAAQAACQMARTKAGEADTRHATTLAVVESARASLRDAKVRVETLEQQHGTETERANRRLALEGQLSGLQARQGALQSRLDALQPAHLESDQVRLRRAVDMAQESINTLTTAREVAKAELQLSGIVDPRTEVEDLQARVDQAEARARGLRQHAEAIRHLATLAEEIQTAAAQRMVSPLLDKVRGYLECVFGPGSCAQLDYDPATRAFNGLRLNRDGVGLGVHTFESLSGGTREQVGVALRLAMAEVLATDHGGCLPVVLDDAFVNSDPDRIKVLQRMLYYAAGHGLQIIVLTCNPSDYSGLGAQEVRLVRAEQGSMSLPVTPALTEPDEAAESKALVTMADRVAFLEYLDSLGGKVGNKTLREALGWEEDRYEAVKENLIGQNLVAAGQGRGGSVRAVKESD